MVTSSDKTVTIHMSVGKTTIHAGNRIFWIDYRLPEEADIFEDDGYGPSWLCTLHPDDVMAEALSLAEVF